MIDIRMALVWLSSVVSAFCITCQPCAADVIVPFGSSWQYLHPTDGIDPAIADTDFETTWHTPTEYDGTAFSGPSPAMLGYGFIDGQSIVTDISRPAIGDRYTAYFRKTITTTQDYEWVAFEILANNGGVLYVDGKVAAFSDYWGKDNYTGRASGPYDEAPLRRAVINDLPAGEHVIAFSLHNSNGAAFQIGFDLQISESTPSPPLENLTWTSASGEIMITGTNSDVGGVLEIPETIGGMPVTSIGDNAFQYSAWNFVTIPDSVTSIGNSAFLGCRCLTGVTLPNSITSIGAEAFAGCISLISMTIPDSVTGIGAGAFSSCVSLTNVVVPNSVTSIGIRAFVSCHSVTSVSIGDSLTIIGYQAFGDCNNLTSVTIGEGVTSIGDEMFRQCANLKRVTLPDSMTDIGDEAFVQCSGLTSVTIPAGVTSVGSRAFYGCSSLTNVTFLNEAPEVNFDPFSRGAPGAQALVRAEHLASFGGEGAIWNDLIVRTDPLSIGRLHVTGNSIVISFFGEASFRSWSIMGSSDLKAFDENLTAAFEITEIAPGEYEAVFDVTGNGRHHYFRVGR